MTDVSTGVVAYADARDVGADAQGMTPDLDYLYTLGEARSCLAALAAIAADDDESAYFERLLIYLDVITDDVGPATWPMRASRAALVDRLGSALRRLADASPASRHRGLEPCRQARRVIRRVSPDVVERYLGHPDSGHRHKLGRSSGCDSAAPIG